MKFENQSNFYAVFLLNFHPVPARGVLYPGFSKFAVKMSKPFFLSKNVKRSVTGYPTQKIRVKKIETNVNLYLDYHFNYYKMLINYLPNIFPMHLK